MAAVGQGPVRAVLAPTLVLIAGLVLVVRPVIAAASTFRTALSIRERVFVGWMDPRGIVAASTAATFGAPLAAAGIGGANKLLPATFLVIVGTVTIYGLTAAPVARLLGLTETTEEEQAEPDLPDEPRLAPPMSDQ